MAEDDKFVDLEVSLQRPREDYINMRVGSIFRMAKDKDDLLHQLEDLGTEVKRIDRQDTLIGKIKNLFNLP